MPNLGQIVYLEKSELSKDPIGRELETRQKTCELVFGIAFYFGFEPLYWYKNK